MVEKKNQLKKTVFENGLTLVTERVSEFKSLSIGVWVKTGTRHESDAVAGVSHFLEHMLFKGTSSRSALQIAREIDQVGGDFNAFTAREYTCFHLLLLSRDCSLGMEILADVLLNSSFHSEEIELERKVILQELYMVEDSPEEIAYDLFFEKVYPEQGLGRPILGTEKSIKRMKRKELVEFFRFHYRPENLVVSVSGDVSHEQVKKKLGPLIKKRWPGRPKDKVASTVLAGGDFPNIKRGKWFEKKETEQVHLIWGVPGPEYSSPLRYAVSLLNIHLGGGMSSTLFQEIREKNGLAYTVYSSLSPFSDTGLFSIYAATSPSQVKKCLGLIEKCARQVAEKKLSKNEFKGVQANMKSSLLLASDNAESRMFSIARNELFLGRQYTTEELCAAIDRVTPDQIQMLAQSLFQQDCASVLAFGPRG